MYDLEVLDRSLGDASVEVQDVRLSLLVPAGRLVRQGHQVVCVAVGVANQQSLDFLRGGGG